MSDHASTRRTVLRTTAGLAAATAGLTATAGSAAAHFPRDLAIDVKPGSDRNAINPRSNGVISVAVVATDGFDPTTADVRYRFGAPDVVSDGGGARVVGVHARDVDGDAHDDLVLRFRTDDCGFDRGDGEAELRWDRDDSREHGLSGRDEIRTVGGGRPR